ncbi:hypothetical protein HNS38_10240 [Lentimicrobium sp. L6]|uniref:hypothetical protein n=1 Tax=Lentimicrobium sp. L6 TaxID=2735916 RepID=UPI00155492A6|nr:hypothetical protein [Lentimicrobium sp. L6]NPD85140.1 hypothetical protein [Lentimicrobium sp. L6]
MKPSTINIKGKSGQKYLFHTYSLPAKLTTVGGVYIYLRPLKGGDFKVLKIGHTHNFDEEMKNTTIAKKLGATHITALQKNNKSKRELIVKDIWYLLR